MVDLRRTSASRSDPTTPRRTVRVEELRLRRIFKLLLTVAAPVAACTSDPTSTDAPGDAGGEDVDNSLPVGPGEDATGPTFGNNDANILQSLTWCDAGPPVIDPKSTNCDDFLRSPCGLPNGITPATDSGQFTNVQCDLLCTRHEAGLFACMIYNGPPDGSGDAVYPTIDMDGAPEGALVFDCEWCNNGGRRPPGFRRGKARGSNAMGLFFARMAELESASIRAFRTIRRELVAHGAPRDLVEAAEHATRDEARHAKLTRAIARRHGAEPPPVHRSQRSPIRSLEEFALDNAIEGCVNETFGALVAHFQAKHARDEQIATVMGEIAADETRHAALAWAISRWVEKRIDDRARERVSQRRARAQRRLARSAGGALPRVLSQAAGLPTPAQVRLLLRRADTLLWRG
jgi:hypothetical protein